MTTNKPDVKRYDCTSGRAMYCYGCYTMEESELGDYVEWEAYEALQAECERLKRYYKNGIECFANPCERHSGGRTPPFSDFFEKYGGQCLICVVDNNKTLQANIEELRRALAESQANDRQAMAYLNEVRALVGGNDFPDMVERVAKLQAERDKLREEGE